MIDQMRLNYREEATELLSGLEGVLLELEASPRDSNLIDHVFRQMHTIKGSGAMFGFDRIASFTHEVETTFDLVRAGRMPVSRDLITLTLEARDHIKTLLESEFGGPPANDDLNQRLLEAFRAFTSSEETGPRAAPALSTSPLPPSVLTTYRIRFRPPVNAFLTGTNLVLLLNALRDLGRCDVSARTEDIPLLASLDPERCYLFWDLMLTTSEDENAIRDVFVFVEDESELSIERVEICDATQPTVPRIGEILVDRQDVAADDLDEVLQSRQPLGAQLVAGGKAHPDAIRSALSEQAHLKETQNERRKTEASATVRVPADKLDKLMNTVGEMVTAQARLHQLASTLADPEFEFAVEELERLTGSLRDDTMSIRMLPIGATFARFRRLVRDLSRDLGKEVELVTEGAETELDKNVIEQLNDPLVHLIRNCIDHGVETPACRQAAGKPLPATIRLSAVHSGAHVLVSVSDDGAGLDREMILAKATASGLVEPNAVLTDEEVFDLIFRPGFSTAANVTAISGRGVGLDVVRRAIESLRGSVEVKSTPGGGAVFTLKLPLTLAIIDGLLISIGTQYFILPVSNIVECVELSRNQALNLAHRRAVVVREELIPYLVLRDYFDIPGDLPDISHVMIAETPAGKFGFVVDCVVGDHQTVIKNLGRLFRHVDFVSGATVLGDGTVALILDLDKLVKAASRIAA